jgi:SecD/SecF fusion protein
VLIALMHDVLITSGVYSLTGRVVTTSTVAALLTILGYSLYDTIIVFDRVRENVPRMPRAAFSQIVNRSMAEVLTRSIATTSCTLMPIVALLLFGGTTLRDFAFALLIGVASGAYSSIFIASPVLTHWKEREHGFEARRQRILAEVGHVPAYAAAAADVDPSGPRGRGRTGRLTTPDSENVSAAEFEQMKRDLALDELGGGGQRSSTRSITKRLAHTAEEDAVGGGRAAAPRSPARPSRPPKPPRASKPAAAKPAPTAPSAPTAPTAPTAPPPGAEVDEPQGERERAPDIAENEGMSPVQKPKPGGASKSRNRRHGRRR